MTEVIEVDPEQPHPRAIRRAAKAIRLGGTVAFPTETVYGLGANALSASAVRGIFEAKGRPPEDPIIVHLASAEDLLRVARDVPPKAPRLARALWPGPLTLVLRKSDSVPPVVTADLATVGVRVPAHAVALALLRVCDLPLAAPSANRFGHASPTTARHVLDDLDGRIDIVLDGGPSTVGVESTVLDLTVDPPSILRPGGVSRERLEELIGRVEVRGDAAAGAPPSPGLLQEHYAVRAELILVEPQGDDPRSALAEIARLARRHHDEGRRVGLLVADEDLPALEGVPGDVRSLGSATDLTEVARCLFAALRALEAEGVEVIATRSFGERGLGLAIRDRLRRAASEVIPLP